MGEKICPKCGHKLPVALFSRNRSKKDGLQSYCKQCALEANLRHQKTSERYRQTKRTSQAQKDAQRRYADKPEVKVRKANQAKERYRRQENQPAIRAHRAVSSAVRSGKLTPEPCEVCGHMTVDAHHDDYKKPLDVRWFCRLHHMELHHGPV